MPAPDYQTLIDAETWAFIDATAAWYPPDATSRSIEGQREVYNRMCAGFHHGHPPGVATSDETLSGVLVRVYTLGPTSAATILYFHGGGFVVGGLDSHDDVCAELCAATGCKVISTDYRLVPEHPHPAAYEDALAVTLAVPGPIILVGDSAGGALAASVAHATRRRPEILGQVLIYPGLGGDRTRGSFLRHAEAPMLTLDEVAYYGRLRHGGTEPVSDPTATVLQDTDFSGLPPTFVFSAECDPLADDGRDYRNAIVLAGGSAEWVLEPGLVHGYLRARHSVRRAKASFRRICAVIWELADRA